MNMYLIASKSLLLLLLLFNQIAEKANAVALKQYWFSECSGADV